MYVIKVPLYVMFGLFFTTFIITLSLFIVNKPWDCVPVEKLRINCYESDAKLYLEIYYKLRDNNTAFINCGPVRNCDTSPCKYDIIMGNNYYCQNYERNQIRLSIYKYQQYSLL